MDRLVVCHQHGAVARAAQGLEGREAEHGDIGESARWQAVIHSAGGQRRVFNDLELVAVGQSAQGFDIGRVPVQVDRQDGARSLADLRFNRRDVHGVVGFQHIAEHGPSAAEADGAGGGNVGIADGDDLVAGTDADSAQGDDEGDSAGVGGHGVTRLRLGGEGRFQLAAQRVAVLVGVEEDGLQGGDDFVAHGLVGLAGARAGDAEGPGHQARPRTLGSSKSRSQSPRKTTPSTVMVMAMPG